MKRVISTFIICCILTYCSIFFVGSFIQKYWWGFIPVVALILTVFIETTISLEGKIKALEKRLDELEGKKEMEEDGTK